MGDTPPLKIDTTPSKILFCYEKFGFHNKMKAKKPSFETH